VRFLNGFIPGQLVDKAVGFCGVAAPENGAFVMFDDSDFIGTIGFLPEVVMVLLVHQSKNRPAYGYPWLALVPGFFPCFFIQSDLLGLLDVEGLAALVVL